MTVVVSPVINAAVHTLWRYFTNSCSIMSTIISHFFNKKWFSYHVAFIKNMSSLILICITWKTWGLHKYGWGEFDSVPIFFFIPLLVILFSFFYLFSLYWLEIVLFFFSLQIMKRLNIFLTAPNSYSQVETIAWPPSRIALICGMCP